MINDPTLVVLIPGFPADETDSSCLPAQQRFIQCINRLYPAVRVEILAFQYPFNASAYQWHGNNVNPFGGRNKGGLSRWLLWRKVTKALDQLNSSRKITGVLSFWGGECALAGSRWARKNAIRHYCWLMGQDARKENRYIKRTALKSGDLVSISDFNAGEMKANHGIEPAQVIPIGMAPVTITATQKKDIAIFCAGSLIPLKQYHLAIEVMRNLVNQFPNAGMIISGKGPEEERLRALLRENNLQNKVLLLGEKPHAEVLELMGRSRVFLHPSAYEGFSMACLEALACGAEVISFHQPMKKNIPKWHVTGTIAEMTSKTIERLNAVPDPAPVLPFTIEVSTRQVMKLFGF